MRETRTDATNDARASESSTPIYKTRFMTRAYHIEKEETPNQVFLVIVRGSRARAISRSMLFQLHLDRPIDDFHVSFDFDRVGSNLESRARRHTPGEPTARFGRHSPHARRRASAATSLKKGFGGKTVCTRRTHVGTYATVCDDATTTTTMGGWLDARSSSSRCFF